MRLVVARRVDKFKHGGQSKTKFAGNLVDLRVLFGLGVDAGGIHYQNRPV